MGGVGELFTFMIANLENSEGATLAASQTQLTRPSLFILVTTLALANAYQPASGSFIFGPSSRFWRISPVSSLVELYIIVKRILGAIPRFATTSFDLATHVDANLVDARLAFTGSAIQGSNEPSEERVSDAIHLEDEEAFDLGTGPYQDPWESLQNRPEAYDLERVMAKASWLESTLERVFVFFYMFWQFLLVQSYCLVIARAMNASTGTAKYLELKESRNDLRRRHQCYQDTLREMHENWRFRLGISLPILAQYVKIMVVDGITIPKVLASIYFSHWLLLEVLLSLATFCKQNYKDLTKNVDAYLSNPYYHTTDVVEESDSTESDSTESDADGIVLNENPLIMEDGKRLLKEIQQWPYNEKENVLMYSHLLLFLCWLKINAIERSSASVFVITTLLVFGILAVFSLKRYVQVEGKTDYILFFRTGKRKIYSSRRKNDPIFGGYAVGGDLGLGCLILWALWCILFYDSEGTSRPSWPWLDFLG